MKWTACLGNLLEHYDTALFGFLAPFLAPHLFPHEDPIVALILTYAITPVGMVARPLGALVFGYIGDAYGRREALFLTLTGMAIVSGSMALIPTYADIGILAPLLFCLARGAQNFLAGGETMGGAIFLLENSPEKRHDFLSGLYSASTMGGHLLASFGVYWLVDYNWRVLYLLGCSTALFGCLLRRHASYTSPFTSSNPITRPFTDFWVYRKPLLLIALVAGFASANYSMALVLMNGFIPLVTTFTKSQIMELNSYLLILDLCALPFFGWLAAQVSREKLMLTAALGVVFGAIPLCMLLENGSLLSIITVRTCFVLFGVAFFAPFHAWAGNLVPPAFRFALISLGYALGTQILGAPTVALSLWCYKKTGVVASISWYWILLALASSLAILRHKAALKEKIA